MFFIMSSSSLWKSGYRGDSTSSCSLSCLVLQDVILALERTLHLHVLLPWTTSLWNHYKHWGMEALLLGAWQTCQICIDIYLFVSVGHKPHEMWVVFSKIIKKGQKINKSFINIEQKMDHFQCVTTWKLVDRLGNFFLPTLCLIPSYNLKKTLIFIPLPI